ncbi:hypothetical protein OFC62_40195, partial [Escherichia coli]|nr:hypothetical protein [Escherichia coli]
GAVACPNHLLASFLLEKKPSKIIFNNNKHLSAFLARLIYKKRELLQIYVIPFCQRDAQS